MADVLGLLVRAKPLLLLWVTFLFLTTEVWEVAVSLDRSFLVLTVTPDLASAWSGTDAVPAVYLASRPASGA